MCDVTGTTDTPRKSVDERGGPLSLCEIFKIQQFSSKREKGVERSHALRKLRDYFRASPPEYLVSLQNTRREPFIDGRLSGLGIVFPILLSIVNGPGNVRNTLTFQNLRT